MTRTRSAYLALVAVLLSPMAANADSILADEVTVSYDFGAIGNPQCGPADVKTTTVAADSSDAVTVLDCISDILVLTVDMNASGFESTWELLVRVGFDLVFDGLVISGLDWDSVPGSYVIETNLPGWVDSSASFSATDMSFNYNVIGALSAGSYFFDVHAVPEPGTLALLGIGLFGMGLARRRQAAGPAHKMHQEAPPNAGFFCAWEYLLVAVSSADFGPVIYRQTTGQLPLTNGKKRAPSKS
jgi:hypothetical protein